MPPTQKPGKSRQDYRTPPEFLRAVAREFHVAVWGYDLAATAENRVNLEMASVTYHLGPGSKIAENALAVDWSQLPGQDFCDMFLNPPFADIEPWVSKCARTVRRGRIFMLVPAAVGSNWYALHVHARAHVIAISPRLTFQGESAPYPKDIVLLEWSGVKGGFSTWRWK
jgi:hypothetical protein